MLVALTASALAFASGLFGPPGPRPFDHTAVLVLLAMTAALLARDRQPLAVLVGCTLGFLGLAMLDYELDTFGMLFVAVHAVGRQWDLPRSGVALAAPLLVCFLGTYSPDAELLDIVLFGLVGTLLWSVGVQARLHEQQLARAMLHQATLQHALQAQHERAAIARDVHDIVAHGLGAIRIQAASAVEIATNDPESARRSLQAIVDVSGDAMREIRGLVRALREAEQPPATTQDLHAVLHRTEALGLRVDAHIDDTFDEASPPVRAAIHRLVQEATANTLRHAGATRVRVRVDHADGSLVVTVDDDGCGGEIVAGHGLCGMRERIEALGGSMTVRSNQGGLQLRAIVCTRSPT